MERQCTLVLGILLPALLLLTGACRDSPAYDRFGGYTAVQREASGHFRVEQVNGRWMFITPEGHPYFALGANHVGKFLEDDRQTGAILERFAGDRKKAEEALFQAMVDMGLNASEAYKPLLPSLITRMPYIAHIDYPDGQKLRFDIFDPLYRQRLDEQIGRSCAGLNRDSFLLGIAYADLPIWDGRRMDYFRQLPPTAPGRQRYLDFLREQYADIEALNESYATRFSSFAAVDTLDRDHPAVAADDEAFLGIIADTLYANLRRLTRKYAPDKLFLGERFVLRMVSPTVLGAVGRYVDVFCTQALILSPQRPPEWQVFQRDAYAEQYALSGEKPMIIIDWAAPFSLDSTYTTDRGAIKDEATAAEETASWLEGVGALPYVIGVFKCQLIGAHGNDRWFPAGRMKRTYLRDDGRPFAVRTAVARRSHRQVLSSVYQSLQNE